MAHVSENLYPPYPGENREHVILQAGPCTCAAPAKSVSFSSATAPVFIQVVAGGWDVLPEDFELIRHLPGKLHPRLASHLGTTKAPLGVEILRPRELVSRTEDYPIAPQGARHRFF